MNTYRKVVFSILIGALTYACGGQVPSSSETSKKTLRDRAKHASNFDYKKPIGQPIIEADDPSNPPRKLSLENTVCTDKLSCFPRDLYMVAEGIGPSYQAAELDAQTRLSAQVHSEVRGLVTTFVKEGEGIKSQNTSEIRNQVTTYFKHGELIELIRIPSVTPNVQSKRAFAVLNKHKYNHKVSAELNPLIINVYERVSKLSGASSPIEFKRVAPLLEEFDSIIKAQAVEYRSVMGRYPKDYQKTRKRIKILKTELEVYLSNLVFIIELQGEAQGEFMIRQVMKKLVSSLNLRAKSPGECLNEQYLIRITYSYKDSIHPLTGSTALALNWQAALHACDQNGPATVLSEFKLPIIRGVERYQQSAEQVIKNKLTKVQTQLSKTDRHNQTSKLTNALKDSTKQLLSEVIPIL